MPIRRRLFPRREPPRNPTPPPSQRPIETSEVSEQRDDAGRLIQRDMITSVEEFDGRGMSHSVVVRREFESYAYRVSRLDDGDGSPPDYTVTMTRKTYHLDRAASVLRQVSQDVETMPLYEAQRREMSRRFPGAPFGVPVVNRITRPGFGREPRHAESPFPPSPVPVVSTNSGIVIHGGNNPDPYPAGVLPLPHRPPSDGSAATPPDHGCALKKGCHGFCAACSRCQLHCACPKAETPPLPTRRIRLK